MIGIKIITEKATKKEILSMLRLVSKIVNFKFHNKRAKNATKKQLEHALYHIIDSLGHEQGLFFN